MIQDLQNNKKFNPVKILFLIGGGVFLVGIIFIFAGRGAKLFEKLEMTQPQPTNTMIEPQLEVSDALKGEKVLGELKQVDIDGTNFKFTPSDIIVNQGDTVQINFINSQGMHNFTIDGINVSTKVLKQGMSEQVTFVASKKGIYNFYCNVGNHKSMGMIGTITVN